MHVHNVHTAVAAAPIVQLLHGGMQVQPLACLASCSGLNTVWMQVLVGVQLEGVVMLSVSCLYLARQGKFDNAEINIYLQGGMHVPYGLYIGVLLGAAFATIGFVS